MMMMMMKGPLDSSTEKNTRVRLSVMENKLLELFPTCILLAYMHIYDSNYRACYCPCSVSPWHEEDDLFIHQSGIQIRPFQPGKLIHHLISTGKSKQSGMTEIYHYIMLTFMNGLFKTCMVQRYNAKHFIHQIQLFTCMHVRGTTQSF